MTASSVARQLGHSFSDPLLLRTALTHRSFGTPNNERLEFLGDGILDCAIAAASLGLGVGGALRLGEGELKSGGALRPSILADALEALFGAIYLDAGFVVAQAAIDKLYAPLLATLKPGEFQKDAKTRLQEWLQGRKKPLPRYQLLEATGAAHEQRFEVACQIESPSLRTVGHGPSRRIAEQVAADKALKELNA
ncbi:MAG: ribonuclease III [Betaproteobacteria bacterium HGW-Betaproteobacteria-6]|nr:MAG: ribonuclease III [Betaproteobacteria bacterium HGW-Betaproteobacteria-6]